ncbi:Re/Si-specific NAD(P)(+) transhydrogenase subunit alpha [Rarobacter incanus]|uniref:proton-translocating NAD(P)(+) transhydrogenase n=1 Tax=Rarobacter incanus TaxID=153494 RepID=A0A542SQU7_9MICO|nr:Re/Si-specific NAD(P)(+) transhydrogenase subunit alpha [Rarobacter incanus]TQK76991.1 NAD(P) transhydrogenase subunit alpha [Rarobacter incanus]
MRIGVPKESAAEQRIVAATPKTVAKLKALGYEVAIESGAGARANFMDEAYQAAGAAIVTADEAWRSDIVIKMDEPTVSEIGRMTKGATVISRMAPSDHPELIESLKTHGVTGLCLDAVPRISRAQSLDVLSSMSNIAGYRAVIEGAEAYGGMFGGQVTAAGKTAPATVFVIGAGVAGLAALGAAGSLGAQVRAFDVRPEVAEQIESMGATFVRSAGQQEVSADGYAKPLTDEQVKATEKTYAEESAKADIVITTALVRGKAVRTITKEMVAAMKPGSVIVDLAASGGGNCELTIPGHKIVTDNGVTIVGYTDLPGRMAAQASQLYGTNIVNLLQLCTPKKDGELVLDMDDVVQRAITVARAGEVLWPPPPVQVSAAPKPAAQPAAAPAQDPADRAKREAAAAKRREQKLFAYGGIAAVLIGLAITFSSTAFLGYFTVFILAVFIGFYVITNVTHSLHTPLMAQTNAISGIILVGALLQLGSDNLWVVAVAFVAAAVAAINIFGGFLVASRMINMFHKEA